MKIEEGKFYLYDGDKVIILESKYPGLGSDNSFYNVFNYQSKCINTVHHDSLKEYKELINKTIENIVYVRFENECSNPITPIDFISKLNTSNNLYFGREYAAQAGEQRRNERFPRLAKLTITTKVEEVGP